MKVSLNNESFPGGKTGPTVGMYCTSHKMFFDTCAREKKWRTTGLIKLGIAHPAK